MRNGSGTYVLPAGQPVVTGTTISSTVHNTLANDLANALTTSIATDGQSVVTANIPFAGYKLTGIGAATVNGDAVRYEQVGALGNAQISAPSAIASINGGQIAGHRRKNVNGDFSENIKGVTSPLTLAAGVYGHDGWRAGSGGCTYSFSTTAGLTTITITAGTLVLPIEGKFLQTGTVVIGFNGTSQWRLVGGSTYFASGTTTPTTGGTQLNLEFTTGTLTLVQVENGTTRTSYEYRDDERYRCDRYMQAGAVVWIDSRNVTGSDMYIGGTFNPPMYGTPSSIIRLSDVITGNEAGTSFAAVSGTAFYAFQSQGVAVGGTFRAEANLP